MRCFRDLNVWNDAMTLVVESYRIVRLLPTEERFALADQLRRSVISVPANIAEGNARGSRADHARFVSNSRGSLAEHETLLHCCERLRYVAPRRLDPVLSLCDSVGRQLNNLHAALRGPRRSPVPSP